MDQISIVTNDVLLGRDGVGGGGRWVVEEVQKLSFGLILAPIVLLNPRLSILSHRSMYVYPI